jgi:hypothetical protein
MTRFLWHFDADGWPLERIDTFNGEHVLVFSGGAEESLPPQYGGRPISCWIPKASGVLWGWRS